MQPVVECVPNISEGRRPEVIAAIIDAVRAVPGVTVLDHGMDADHNRAVITFVGAPKAVEEAAFLLTAAATERIDVSAHDGVHPRIGATDVIPFVPLGDTPMQVCVELAERLGERVGRELGIPVFLYAKAARVPRRRELVELRRDGMQGLQVAMDREPEFKPDFGPSKLHPTAGAIAIGARNFLIAYNVELESDDLGVAEEIARRVRASSGGLAAVKALGLPLPERGTVQVSMNLTNYKTTSMGKVYREIERLAQERGVAIRRSELIGLVPRNALVRAAKELLGLEIERDWVLEDRIRAEITGPFEMHDFLEDLASTRPAPGGGAAAALVGSIGAATAAKVAAITKKKRRKDPEAKAVLKKELARLHELRWDLMELVDRDAAAYRGFVEAMRLPKATADEVERRGAAMATAALEACVAPLAIGEAIAETYASIARVAPHVPRVLAADVVAARALGRGAVAAARAMLDVNLPHVSELEREALRERFALVEAGLA